LKLRQARKGEYHEGIDDLALLRKLATRNGLRFVGPDSAPKLDRHDSLLQDSKNDWELAAERAESSGFNIWVRHDTMFAKEPAKIGSPILSLRYRKDFQMEHEFNLRYKLPENQEGRPKIVEYRGRKRGGRRLTGRSKQHARGTTPVQFTRDPAIHTPTYIGRRATAHKELQRDPAFNLSIISIPPLPRVRPDVRDTIELLNLGQLFSGPYLCDRVNHEFSGSGFTTNYTLYRDIA
jgi:hypothetical protein